MPDIASLRRRLSDLSARKAAVRACVKDLQAVRFVPEPAALAHVSSWADEDDTLSEEHLADVGRGVPVPLFSRVGILAVLGGGDSGDFRVSSTVSNLLSHLREMGKLASGPEIDTDGGTPSFDGFTTFEIRAVVDAYRRRIEGFTHEVRDVHTHLCYLRATRSAIPAYARSRCLGMFGGTDRDLGFEYTERDFASDGRVRVERDDPDDPRGPYTHVNVHPRVLSDRYLAPLIGREPASAVEAALDGIDAASAPCPGEPPVLRSFGSHSTNRIEVAYAAGEVDVDDPVAVAPCP